MSFAGLDIHKRVVQAVVLDEQGQVLHRERFAMGREQLRRFARRRLGPRCRVAVEATTNTWSVVELLQPEVAEVVVSNPMRTRAIAQAKIKTDKVDARVLAELLRADYLPRVWQPDATTARKRRLTSRRASYVHDRTRIKNRIHAVLHQRLLEPPVGDLFSKKGRAWLATLDLDPDGRAGVDAELRLLTAVETEIDSVTTELVRDAYQDRQVRLLVTLPGVDVAVAQGLMAALGDISRFRDGDHAASYLGLVPSTRQSANHCYHGPITKQGRSHARWMLVQAAQHVARHPGPLGVFFRRLAKKKNHNVAVVATARKLVVIAWHMLKNGEPYRYAVPRSTQTKLSRMRVAATGKRRRSGPAKGRPRPSTYGQGGTRTVPALATVYSSEDLPPTAALPPGERKMLRRMGLAPFVKGLQRSRRIPLKATPTTTDA